MGLLDGFTSDGNVDMKHTEYYKLMREAAKAELMENAARCNVPHEYIREMLTGKMEAPEILPEVEEIGKVKAIMAVIDKETLKNIVELAERERLNEIILDNAEKLKAREAAGEKRVPETWSCETCFHYRKGKKLPICGGCEDGSKYTSMDAGQQGQDPDGEREDGSHGNE